MDKYRFSVHAPKNTTHDFMVEAKTPQKALVRLNRYLELKFGDVSSWKVYAPETKIVTEDTIKELTELNAERIRLDKILIRMNEL